VESFHAALSRHEEGFYDIEDFANERAFFDKAAIYQQFCNAERKNRWRADKTPLELIE